MILNQQKSVRIPVRDLKKFFARAMKSARLPRNAASVCFVTSAQIRKWNASYRGKNRPTDVLSFPVEGTPKRREKIFPASLPSSMSSSNYLGDIAIAPAVAKKNAREFGRSFEDELRVLILHGLLHLMGYDHETDTGQMERREKRLRRTLGIG